MTVLRSILLFALVALAEIGGAWLVWQGIREHRGLAFVGAGILALGLYGFACSATHLGKLLGRAPTGRRFERVDEVSIFRFREGRIARVWSLEDNLGRLRQLGITDATG